MSQITAKVQLQSKTINIGPNVNLSFIADYADGRNKEWAAFTPSLQLTMSVKPEVADKFDVGGAYTLTFSPNED